jgi:hypothetical protein
MYCIIGTVRLNDEEKGQIGRSNVVWDAGDDGNAGSAAQSGSCFREPPPSGIVYAVPELRFREAHMRVRPPPSSARRYFEIIDAIQHAS